MKSLTNFFKGVSLRNSVSRSIMVFILVLSVIVSNAQLTVVHNETIPNAYNTAFNAPVSGSFTGSTGTWTTSSNANATIVCTEAYYSPSSPHSIKIVNWNTSGSGSGQCLATSPTVNLNGNSCSPSLSLEFALWTYTCTNGNTGSRLDVDFSSDNGATWTNAWTRTSDQIFDTWGVNGKANIIIGIPAAYRTSNFKYRFAGYATANNPNDFYQFVDDIKILAAPCGSIGDRVWNDTDKNGIKDANETGMTGVVVSLYNSTNVLIASTTTDASGNYLFKGLATSAGGTNYQVQFSLPAEYKFSVHNADAAGVSGSDNSDANITTGRTGNISLTNASPNVTYVDAGIHYTTSARIGDFVWNDMDKDGIQDAGEPGLSGVTVMLYTSANVLYQATVTSNSGYYFFNDVPAGTYYISVSLPIGYKASPKDATSDVIDSDIDPATMKTSNFSVVSGATDLSFDAGLNVTPISGASASIGDRVWLDLDNDNLQDANEPGVAGVTVQLYNNSNVLQSTLATDAFGYYSFNGINPGTYYVKFTALAGFTFVTANTGGNDDVDSDANTATGNSPNYILVTDQMRTNVDAGLRRIASGTTALGDFVWYDLDRDGIQDGGAEVGAPGITVILYNNSNAVVQTTTTDKNGFYMFTGLPASTSYTIGFGNIPAGYGFSPQSGAVTGTSNNDVNPATGRTATITTGAAGSMITYADAGLVVTPNTFNSKASIGDKVWNDLDNDGIQDADEPGVQGVTVTLYASNGTTVLATTLSDAQGNYVFTNLDAGNYVIGFNGLPAGYVFSAQNAGSSDEIDSDPLTGSGIVSPITLAAGEVNMTIDAGVRNSSMLANLGDKVWYDLDGDGIQDAAEPGAEGISVSLLSSGYALLKTTTTDASGNYLFTDLTAGNYYIVFNNLPAGFIATTQNAAGSTSSNNSDAETVSLRSVVIVLGSGATDRNWDLGISSTSKASIGDFVWNDLDRDGQQDAGEPGIAGVTVTLYNSSNVAIGSAVTDANGSYFFPNVDPGTYTIGFSTIPANSGFTAKDAGADATDSDVNTTTGRTDAFTGIAGQSKTDVDAGLVSLLAAVGNYVWRDATPNGIQDAFEAGVPGVTVTLYISADGTIGNGDDIAVTSAVTDSKGYYFINNIPVAAGGSQFYIRFTDLQINNVFTTFNASGSTSANNSDVTSAPATGGRTGFFTLLPGEINLNIDAGLLGPDNGTLPLHRLDLTAQLSGTTVNLKWVAENEMNTSLFTMERSTDGVHYSPIGSTPAVGLANTTTEYTGRDEIQNLLQNSVIFYRIKAEDNTSKFSYSNIVPVRLNKTTSIQVWPNPFVSDIRITYVAAVNTTIDVRVVDNNGRVVKQSAYAVSRGINQVSVNDVETLPSGMYVIQVIDKTRNTVYSQKLTK